ncbi:MAG: nicotinate-nucleotide adenylyltransferase, partial [Gemmatimonadaceae bacterium]
MGAVRVGVLGGTFDPVHNGHLILAEQARVELALDLVLFIPAGEPWRKSQRAITPGSERLAMLRLAIEGNDGFGISDIELRRPGPTYTADTLETLAAERLDDEFWFIIGSDALADMPNWHEPERIVRHATLAVAPRDAVTASAAAAA